MRPMPTAALGIALALLAVTPIASAGDPTISIPSTAPLVGGTTAAANALRDDAIRTHHGNVFNATMAANEAQLLVTPFTRASNITTGTGNFAARSIAAGGAYAGFALGYGVDVVLVKAGEAGQVSSAADGTTSAAVRAINNIAFTTLEVVCSQPPTVPPDCGPGSILGQVVAEGGEVGQALLHAGPPGLGQTHAALTALVEGVTPQ